MVFVFNHTTNQQRTEEEMKVLKSMFPKKQLVMRNYPLPKIDNSMTIEEIAKDFVKILLINKGHAVLIVNPNDEYTRYISHIAVSLNIPLVKDGQARLLRFYSSHPSLTQAENTKKASSNE